MAESLYLVGAIVGLVAHCASAARSLKDLMGIYTGAPAAVLLLSIECTTTSAVLERLEDLMRRRPHLLQPARPGGQDLRASFATLVQEIAETVKLVLGEIQRLHTKGNNDGNNITASSKVKFAWNEEFFTDSLESIRSLRSSLGLMLECLQMESLTDLQLQVQGSSTSSFTRPVAQTSRAQLVRSESNVTASMPRATVKISLQKVSDELAIQELVSKAALVKGRSLKNSRKHAMKLHTAIDQGKDQDVLRMLVDRYNPNMTLVSGGSSPLFRALRSSQSGSGRAHKRVVIIRALVCFGARLDDRDEVGRTPLTYLIRNDDHETLVRLFCEYGSPVNDQDAAMRTALHYVCGDDSRTHLIRILVAHGADVNLKQKDGQTPLYWAAAEGNESTVAKLLELGASPHEVAGEKPNRDTALIRAVCIKNKAIVKMLCDRGVPFDAIDNRPPPLHYAVWVDSVDVVQVLLDAGADLKQKTVLGYPLIRTAAEFASLEMVQFLIERGVNVNEVASDQRTAVHFAVLKRRGKILTALLEAGAQPNTLNIDGQTPLHLAVTRGFIDMARLLVASGAYADYADEEGVGYLDHAVEARSLEMVKFLLSSGVNVRRCRRGKMAGCTALHIAAEQGLDEIVTCLLDHGADLHAMVSPLLSATPLHFAVSGGCLSTVRILIDRGASLDIIADENSNLLSFAVNQPAMLTYLLDVGNLDPNLRDCGGGTALSHAAVDGFLVAVRILLHRGARQYYATEFYCEFDDYLAKKNVLKGTPADLARQRGHPEVAKVIDEWPYEDPVASADEPLITF